MDLLSCTRNKARAFDYCYCFQKKARKGKTIPCESTGRFTAIKKPWSISSTPPEEMREDGLSASSHAQGSTWQTANSRL